MGRMTYYKRDGVTRTMLFDDDEPGKFVQHTEVQMDDILKSIDGLRDVGWDPRSANRLVARVPLTIYEQSLREQWGDDDWKKYLNSNECKPFRIWPGRV